MSDPRVRSARAPHWALATLWVAAFAVAAQAQQSDRPAGGADDAGRRAAIVGGAPSTDAGAARGAGPGLAEAGTAADAGAAGADGAGSAEPADAGAAGADGAGSAEPADVGAAGADGVGSAEPADAGTAADGGIAGEGIAPAPEVGGGEPGPAHEGSLPVLSDHGDGGRVIRTLLGLVALLALAWIGAHPRVQRIEERLGISQVVTSGLPFVVLGLIARAPGLDILNEEVLIALTPLLQFGLGWIGFHTGFQFEGAAMEEVPRGTSPVVILLTGASFVTIAVAGGVFLWAVGLGPTMSTLARDAAIIGLAGALSAPTLGRVVGARISPRALELARTIGVLDDVFGVVALAALFAWLHPSGMGWQLPGVGWLFVTFGMAATLGLVMYTVLRSAESAAESTALLLGSVCFTAGMAGFLSVPPLVVCFFAGMLLKNMPGGDKPRLAAAFARLERPIYLVFLVVVGALWQIDDWRGWAMLPLFVIARVLGRLFGARVARRLPIESRHPGLDEMDDPELVAPPMGALALAFVVTARTLYESPGIQAIVTAVIGGAVATEIIVQIVARRTSRRASVPGTVSAAKSGKTAPQTMPGRLPPAPVPPPTPPTPPTPPAPPAPPVPPSSDATS